jgi:hypothetical protein
MSFVPQESASDKEKKLIDARAFILYSWKVDVFAHSIFE